MTQLTLALPHRESRDGADFFVSSANRAAVGMIDRWPDWPGHALALVGPESCGKSHLAAVWKLRSAAVTLSAEEVGARSRVMMQAQPAAIVEDADRALAEGKLDPVDLLHLYNWLRERRGFLLLTGRTAPARWPVGLRDLASRLAAMPVAEIAPPDDGLLAALMVKRFDDRQIRVTPHLVEFVLTRIDRSCAAVERIVAALDRESLARRRPITLPLARELLSLGAGSEQDAGQS